VKRFSGFTHSVLRGLRLLLKRLSVLRGGPEKVSHYQMIKKSY